MIYYIATIENGQVKNLKLATGDNPAEGEQSDGTTIVHIDFQITDRIDFIKTNYWDGEWKTRTAAPNNYCSWDGSDWVWSMDDLMKDVRKIRTDLLYGCDWTQLPDSPLTDEVKLEWQQYRQELRDLQFVSNDISSVDDVSWPTPPQ